VGIEMKRIISLFIIFSIISSPTIILSDEGKPGEVKVYTFGGEEVDDVSLMIDGREQDLIPQRLIIPPGFHNFTLNWKKDDENFITTERIYIPEGKTNIYLPTYIEKKESKGIYFPRCCLWDWCRISGNVIIICHRRCRR
jgi:hypothetical protein